MSIIMNYKFLVINAVLGALIVPAAVSARVNSLTGGIGVSLDLSDRQEELSSNDYESLAFTPLLLFRSSSEKDNFVLRAAPGIKHDLNNSENDWDSNFLIAADRQVTQYWQFEVSDNFIRTDYYVSDTGALRDLVDSQQIVSTSADPAQGTSASTVLAQETPTSTLLPQEAPSSSEPGLSTDLGRRRYWRNNLNLSSGYEYSEGSSVNLGVGYNALRNDDTGFGGYEDYDRYVANFWDKHRINAIWQTYAAFSFIRGEFDQVTTTNPDELSKDLNEYRLDLRLTNQSIIHNPLSLYYNYIGSRFDEELRDDSDTHQIGVNWKHEFSPHMYTNLGAGPSYAKTEEQDDQWGVNGIAELNYRIEHGFLNFLVEKKYDVVNFSGTNEVGLVDAWDSRLSLAYRVLKDLTLSGRLSYLNEDRKQQIDYQKDRYIAGGGLSYRFWRYYKASVDYQFTKQNSDRIGDDYEDHRVLLTLSWQKELMQW